MRCLPVDLLIVTPVSRLIFDAEMALFPLRTSGKITVVDNVIESINMCKLRHHYLQLSGTDL